jgi:predicted dehydrogenase
MRAGVIGCGAISQRAHIPAFKRLGVSVVAVADVEEKKARSCAKKFGIPRYYSSIKELLSQDLDLVSICTPNKTHAEISIEAARAGKNILVEKPMATTTKDADAIIQACEENGVRVCPIFNWRYIPCVLKAKRRIEEGRIGAIVSGHVVGHDFLPMAWSHGMWFYEKWGLLEDIGTHLIDIVQLLIQSQLVSATTKARDVTHNMPCHSHIQTFLSYGNDALVDLDLAWVTGTHEMSVKLLGTAGTINLDLRNDQIIETHGFTTPLEDLHNSVSKLANVTWSALRGEYFKGAILYHPRIIAEFVKSLETGGKPPITGEEARQVIATIEAIEKSNDQAENQTSRLSDPAARELS